MRWTSVLLGAALLAGSGILAARAQTLGNIQFRSIGPSVSGGRLGDVAGTNHDASLYYVGAAGGGVWKSSDGGMDWEPVFDAQDVAPIGAIAIDPSNENVVWAGTGEAAPRNDVSYGDGIYRTIDGGGHWQRMGLQASSQISRILIDPSNSNHVLAAALGDPFKDTSDRGVYETTDGGTTWKRTLYLGLSSGAADLAWNASNPSVVYAGMWQFRRTNWSIESGGAQDGLYKSIDGGATWTKLTGHGLPDGPMGRIGLAVLHDRVYALIQSSHGLLWRSDDAGANWQFMTADTLINERPFYFSRITVDPSDPNHAFASSVALAETRDGGRTWKRSGQRLHGDHHAMWISADGRRILEGNDGGVGLSLDNGKRWARVNLLPISQVYHIGYDSNVPYNVCAGLQDNGTWCAPSNSLSNDGILAKYWQKVAGGDGTWTWPDPIDSRLIWYSSGGGTNGGELWLYNEGTKTQTAISPYLRDQNVVPPRELRYRFNWESPIAFDPFDEHVAYYGGNVVFRTNNRGARWDAISPDLTRNIKAHQLITGGITNEGTGAETSDTILVIALSPVRRGMIWAGTDDGNIALTRDGGAHWRNVSIPGLDAHARIETVEPSHFSPAVAYANVDRHYAGDRKPYVYRTTDYGAHWTSIAGNLPADQFVRVIREDPHHAQLLYAGLEQSFWASWNAGASWQRVSAGLPAASVRDVRVQPQTNDLLLATHGRGIWILDDATPLQRLAALHQDALLRIRTAYLFNRHQDTFNLLAAGENPPVGALITIYQARAPENPPQLEILDGRGRVVRHLPLHAGAGLQRIAWPLCEDPPQPWTRAPKWNRGESCGATVVPGGYSVRARIDGATFTQRLEVRGAPFFDFTAQDYQVRHALSARLFAIYDGIDRKTQRDRRHARKGSAQQPAGRQARRALAATQHRSAEFSGR